MVSIHRSQSSPSSPLSFDGIFWKKFDSWGFMVVTYKCPSCSDAVKQVQQETFHRDKHAACVATTTKLEQTSKY